MDEGTVFTGVPTMCLLPLTNTRFKVIDEIKIALPRKGVYSELAYDIFDGDAGDFELLTQKNALYLPSITKVLLAEGKYPNLTSNQLFAPFVLVFEEDVVSIEGSILEILNVVH